MAADDAAVVVRLQANLKDYESALKSAVRATERAAVASEKALAGVGKSGGSNVIAANFQKSAGQIANDARVLQFQLNDIFSGLATGQGIRAVQQQLGQIAQQLGGGGLVAGARTMGAALVSMINPINLAVVAFGLLATAAASYFQSTEESTKETIKTLDEQIARIKALNDAFGDATPALRQQLELRQALLEVAKEEALRAQAIAEEYGNAQQALREAYDEIAQFGAKLLDSTDPNNLIEFADALTNLDTKLAANTASAADVERALQALRDSGVDGAAELAGALQQKVLPALKAIEEQAKATGEAITKAINAMVPMMALPPLSSQGGQFLNPQQVLEQQGARTPSQFAMEQPREWLKTKAASKAIADTLDNLDEKMAKELVKLFHVLPESARITSGVRSYEEQARLYARYKSGKGGLAAPPGSSRHEFGRAVDIGAGVDMETLREAVKLFPELEQLKGRAYAIDKVHVQLAGTAAQVEKERVDAQIEGEQKAAEAAEKAQKNIKDWNVEAERRVELEKQIADINGQFWLSESQRAAQVEALRIAEERLNELRKAGIEVTAAQEAQIRSLAKAQADATLASEDAAERQKQVAENQKKVAETMQQLNQQMAGIIGSGLSAFVQDLIAGKDAGEAFNNMLQRMLGQMIDMALQMLVIKPLMNALFGGFGGAGTGFPAAAAGGSVSAIAASSHRQVSPMAFAGAQRYAAGGVVGLRPGEVPIIAHRGEIIVPNARRLAGSGGRGGDTIHNSLGNIAIDMGGRGDVSADNEKAKRFGQNLQKMIQAEMVAQSRPGGILRGGS